MLKDMNNIDDASQINADETLELPGFVYEAKTNENLEELAQQAGVDVENLKKINNLSSDKITKGQKLVIVYNNPDFGVDANQKTIFLNDERTNVLEAPMNKQGIPGVIWEVAFMSAAKGRERMKDPTTMKNYANLITQAVIEYFN